MSDAAWCVRESATRACVPLKNRNDRGRGNSRSAPGLDGALASKKFSGDFAIDDISAPRKVVCLRIGEILSLGYRMTTSQFYDDGSQERVASASLRLRKVLDNLGERLNAEAPSAEMMASFEAFGRAMRDIDENVRRMGAASLHERLAKLTSEAG
jgi:hypothetical protein